jgi:hypothetical protein
MSYQACLKRGTTVFKPIAFTMLVLVALVTVICAAISFRLTPSGLWRIGPVIGVNWNGGAKARFGSVTVGYQSGNWLFERGIISGNSPKLACSFINAGPFFFNHCRPHVPSIDV